MFCVIGIIYLHVGKANNLEKYKGRDLALNPPERPRSEMALSSEETGLLAV